MMCVPTAIFPDEFSEERIAEFHRFALDFNSLLDEMEEWQLRLQAKNAQLLRTALHDPLTGLANRAAFRKRHQHVDEQFRCPKNVGVTIS